MRSRRTPTASRWGSRTLCSPTTPERIILHGESVLLGDRLIEMLRRRVADRFSLWFDYDAPIMLTELGIDGALVGAVSLALHGAWGFGDPTAHLGGALTR